MGMLAILAKVGAKVGMNLLKKQLEDGQMLARKHPVLKEMSDLTVLVADDPKVQAAAGALLATKGFGFAKERVVPAQGSMYSPHKWHKPVIKKLGKYLNPVSKSAIVKAYGLIAMEDRSGSMDMMADVSRAREAYLKRDSDFRHKVYNICRSGYVEDIIFEVAWDLEEQKLPHSVIAGKLQVAFDETIAKNPLNIYVNDGFTDSRLVGVLTNAMIQRQQPLMRVYARGNNAARVVGATKLFADAHGLKWHHTQTKIGRSSACCCHVWNPDQGDNFSELERALEQALIDEHAAAKAVFESQNHP